MPYKNKEDFNKYRRKWRKKRKMIKPILGTTDFSGHRKKNFKKEQKEIEKEMESLGIKRQFT